MKSNRRRDTSPEKKLRSALHAAGWRFRVDLAIAVAGGRVRPDLAFTRRRVAVFVDGCFWHCCPEHGKPPLSHTSYWGPKLARNVERDRADTQRLCAAGWRVVRLWEHVPLEDAVAAVESELRDATAGAAVSPPTPARAGRARTAPSGGASAPRRQG
jgi:DNA mismatch endonuclease (patch repair protein)